MRFHSGESQCHRYTVPRLSILVALLIGLTSCGSTAAATPESGAQTTVVAELDAVVVEASSTTLPNRNCVGTVAGLPADEFLGLDLQQAKELAQQNELEFDIAGQNGQCVHNNASFDTQRVRVSVDENGVIVAARRM